MDIIDERLIAAAVTARENADPSLTGFRCGAAVLTSGGQIFSGSNAEIHAGQILHAETFALGAARNAGHSDIIAMAVVAKSEKPCTPCGQCREWIRAYMPPNAPVFVFNINDGQTLSLRVGDLLTNPPDLADDIDDIRIR